MTSPVWHCPAPGCRFEIPCTDPMLKEKWLAHSQTHSQRVLDLRSVELAVRVLRCPLCGQDIANDQMTDEERQTAYREHQQTCPRLVRTPATGPPSDKLLPKTKRGGRLRRTSMRLPNPMVQEVDRICREHPEMNFTRQQFVESAIREKIERTHLLEHRWRN